MEFAGTFSKQLVIDLEKEFPAFKLKNNEKEKKAMVYFECQVSRKCYEFNGYWLGNTKEKWQSEDGLIDSRAE